MPLTSGLASASRTGDNFITKIAGGNFSNSAVVDSDGNSYHIGSAGVVRKLNSRGAKVSEFDWSIEPNGSAIDSSGNLYLGGASATTANFIKVDPSGTVLLQRSVTLNSTNISGHLNSIAVDSSGNIYLAVEETPSGFAYSTSYIFKFTNTGTLSWTRRLVNTGFSSVPYGGISVDSSGNVYVAGYYDTNAAIPDGYLVKYNTSGTLQWQRKIYVPAGGNVFSSFIRADSTGNSYVMSDGSGTTVFKYNTSGTFQWAVEVQGNSGGLSVDGTHVYAMTWGTYITIYKLLASNGSLVWQRRFANTGGSLVSYGISHNDTSVYFGGYGAAQWGAKFPATGREAGTFYVDGTAQRWTYSVSTLAFLDPIMIDGASALTSSSVTLSSAASSTTYTAVDNGAVTRRI